ncbi:hypothetical protein Tco_0148205, partial [Tanacetum coccineum]
PIILGRPFLRTAKDLIDLYEETLTLRVGKEEVVYYADKSEKNKDKNFVHTISVIDFSKSDPFSGSTTTHSNDSFPSSSPVKTSDNLEEFAYELTLLKKIFKKEIFKIIQILFLNLMTMFKSSTINPLFDEIEEDKMTIIPPGVENDDSEDEDHELPNLDHQDDPSIPHPPPDVEKCFEPEA